MRDYQLNFLSKIVSSISGLVISVVLARYLGVVLRGELAFLTQASSMAAIFLGFGLAQAFPFFFRLQGSTNTFALFLRIFLRQFVVFGVFAGVAAFLIDDAFISCLLLLTVVTTLYQQLEASMAAYRIRLKIWVNIVLSVARVLAHVAMFMWFPTNLLWPVLISSALWLGAVACYVVAAGVHVAPLQVFSLREILSYSWMIMLSSLLVVMSYNIDTLLIKWLGTPDDLGNYAVAAGIIVYLWVIPDAIKEVLVSRVVRTQDPRAVILPLKAALLCGAGGVIALVLSGPFLIPWLFGKEFASAALLSTILSLGLLSMIYYKILGVVVLAEGHRIFYLATLASSVLLNVMLNIVTIPKFGAEGAAWVCVGSYGLTGAAFLVYFCRIKGLGARDVAWVGKEDIRSILKLMGSK